MSDTHIHIPLKSIAEQVSWNITILAGFSFISSWAEAAVVSDANPSMFARWVARRFGVKDKRKRHSAGPVGPSQTDPSQSGQCHQEELHWCTAKHCHFHIHTLTRIQKDWECWWMYVWTAYCIVIIYWTDTVLQGSTAGKVLSEECVRQDWDRQAQRVWGCLWFMAVFCEKRLKLY